MILYIIIMIAQITAHRSVSTLFEEINQLQGGEPWGRFLDAGTGTNSIGWISTLDTDRWTTVSGAEAHAIQVRDAVAMTRRPRDRIVVGNWADPGLLAGETYDTVLADYVLAAEPDGRSILSNEKRLHCSHPTAINCGRSPAVELVE